MFIEDQHAMGLEVVITGKSIAGKKIVHGFIELEPQRGGLMVEQEEHSSVIFLAHADFNSVRNLQ